jgi:hypothetical protein
VVGSKGCYQSLKWVCTERSGAFTHALQRGFQSHGHLPSKEARCPSDGLTLVADELGLSAVGSKLTARLETEHQSAMLLAAVTPVVGNLANGNLFEAKTTVGMFHDRSEEGRVGGGKDAAAGFAFNFTAAVVNTEDDSVVRVFGGVAPLLFVDGLGQSARTFLHLLVVELGPPGELAVLNAPLLVLVLDILGLVERDPTLAILHDNLVAGRLGQGSRDELDDGHGCSLLGGGWKKGDRVFSWRWIVTKRKKQEAEATSPKTNKTPQSNILSKTNFTASS